MRKKLPARRRKSAPVGDWLPLPMVLTLTAGVLMFVLFQFTSLGTAALAAGGVGLLGWWWWHHSAYHGQTGPRPARRPTTRGKRRSAKTR